MEDLIAAFWSLSPSGRFHVQQLLCRHALAAWQGYVRAHSPIHYIESVVGSSQTVDERLPADALRAAAAGEDSADVDRRYREPIAALQDGDLEFPPPIEYSYYAIYNLFRRHVMGVSQVDEWLVVNQALSSNPNPEAWRPMLAAALAHGEVASARQRRRR